jgi:hypothetical protein
MSKEAAAPEQSTALARIQQIQTLDPQALIQTALDKSAPVETLERLFELAKNVQKERARQAWYAAMADFQRECPPILRSSTAQIATKSGSRFSYSYANLAEIMSKIQPVMGRLGLSISFHTDQEQARVIAVCRVSHEMGHHEESGKVGMPVPTADMGATEPQRVGIALTYAKRYALLAITGIAPQDEEDEDCSKDRAGVSMPGRASEPPRGAQAAPATAPLNAWTGKIIKVGTRSGKTNDKPWTLYLLTTNDAQEFSTFDKAHADFAEEAGPGGLVRIVWEKTPKGSMKVLSIEPCEEGA